MWPLCPGQPSMPTTPTTAAVKAGSAVLEVAQGRQPCWKLDDRFARAGMARRVQDTGRTGWYYRVREPGHVRAGDTLAITARPHPGWPLARLADLLYRRTLDRALLESAAQLPLPGSWQRLIGNRLRDARVEDWEPRLSGPSRDGAPG